MKKQLLAAAVATAIAAPMTATAGDVTLGGVMFMSIDSVDLGDTVQTAGPFNQFPGTNQDAYTPGYDGLAVNTHFSNFFIKGTEDLGNGLSAFFHMEFLISPDDNNAVSNNRNTYVGLAGNWGKVGIGRNDSPYKKSTGGLELFGNLAGDYQNIGFHDVRMQNTLFYYSPNWNGFSFGAAIGMPSNDSVGPATPFEGSDGVEEVSLAGTYKNGPWFASLAYEERSQEFLGFANNPIGDDHEKWRMGLGYTANGFHVGFIYEDNDSFGGNGEIDYDVYRISGSYSFGNNVVKAAYSRMDVDSSNVIGILVDEPDQFSIGLDHKLSKRTKLFATYTDFDGDDNNLIVGDDYDYDVFSVGIVHKF